MTEIKTDVYSVKEMAKLLGIGNNSAYALIKEKKIGSLKVGNKIIVPRVCINDYLDSARINLNI